MLFSQLSRITQGINRGRFGNRGRRLRENLNASSDLLILLGGIGLGFILAYLISQEAWIPLLLVFVLPLSAVLFTHYPFVAVVIWLLLAPFFALTENQMTRYMFWMLHRLMLPVALGLDVLSRLLRINKRRGTVKLGAPELAMGIFLVLAVLNILFLQPDITRVGVLFYDRVVVAFCLYLLVRLTTPDGEEIKRLVSVALVILLAESVIVYAAVLFPGILPKQWASMLTRPSGTFRLPITLTTTILFSGFLVLQAGMTHKFGGVRLLYLAAFGMGITAIFFTFSRGSWLGALLACIGLFIIYPKILSRMIIIAAILGLLIVDSGLFDQQIEFARRRLVTENTADNRVIEMYASIEMIKLKPLFGWGYENFDLYDRQFQTGLSGFGLIDKDITSHNTYLTIMSEQGLLAFLFYMAPFAWWLVRSIKAWPKMPKEGFYSRPLLLMWWLVILAHFVAGNLTDARASPFGLALWWLSLGFIANIVTTDPKSILDRKEYAQVS